jgi:peptidoglycan/xylan/chitin deacetylase (PgdA/CDA1 family)
MRWQGLALQAISGGISLARMPFAERQGLRILIYHAVGSLAYGDYLGLNTISVERFCEHLDILADMITAPLLPIEMPTDELRIAITFDDGYADNLYVAAPLLVERGIPFTIFVTSDFVRKQMDGFLSRSELKQLAQMPGATIGAHGRSHCNLTQCSKEELRAELEDSKHYLEDLIGLPVVSLAYPYGAADGRVRDAVQRAGYQVGTCSRFDINRVGRDALMLNRCVILRDDSPRVMRQKLRGDWDWYRWRSVDPINIKGALA